MHDILPVLLHLFVALLSPVFISSSTYSSAAYMQEKLLADASIFQLGDIEPFQQHNRCSSSFELQFDVCDNKVVIAANIRSSFNTHVL